MKNVRPTSLELQRYIARCSIGGSTLRNMVETGGVNEVREFLSTLDIAKLNRENFDSQLNRWTGRLQRRRNVGFRGDGWGPARKSLNIFLKNLCYDFRSRKTFGLAKIHDLLEVPLDNGVMTRIREYSEDSNLHRAFVSQLTHEISQNYQHEAQKIARESNMLRVDLDVLWWS